MKNFLAGLNGVVIDVETGGLDPEKHALLMIGYIVLIDGLETDEGVFRIQPPEGLVLTDEALRVNGWNPQLGDLEEALVLDYLREVIQVHLPSDLKPVVIGHNVDFDITFLSAACRRHSLTNPLAKFSYRRIDTASVAVPFWLVGRLPKGRSLDNLREQFGIVSSEAHHDPLVDCRDTLTVLRKMVEWASGLQPRSQ